MSKTLSDPKVAKYLNVLKKLLKKKNDKSKFMAGLKCKICKKIKGYV